MPALGAGILVLARSNTVRGRHVAGLRRVPFVASLLGWCASPVQCPAMVTILPSARRIELSVGELVEGSGRRVIGLGGTGLTRLWIGQELHRRVQEAACAAEPGYRAEVPAAGELEVDGWRVRLQGRADGVVFTDGHPVRVDEIKTLHFAVDLNNLYAQERLETFRHQLRLYAYLLSGLPDDMAAARLVLVDIVSGEIRTEEVRWSVRGVEAFIRQQVHRFLAAHRRRSERIARLRRTARSLPFPHAAPRPVQEKIIAAVADSLEAGRHLLLSAPTGSGKTAAVLHPALVHALAHGRRVIFLTAKTLQQRIAVETLRAMQTVPFASMQVRSKQKMCANTEMICHEELCPYAEQYAHKMARSGLLPALLADHRHLDPDVVFERAVANEVCPFEVGLEALGEMDVVVCDYNYVFDPGLGLHTLLGGDALADAVLIVDEAHNLIQRSREYYSPALTTAMVSRTRAFLAGRRAAVFALLDDLVEELGRLIDGVVAGAVEAAGRRETIVELPEARLAELRVALDAAMLEYWLYKRENELWMADDPVMEMFLAVTRFHRVLRLGGGELVHIAAADPEAGATVRILCRDASRFLGAVVGGSAATIAMSATLKPPEFYRQMLGLPEDKTEVVHVPSPFPEENRLVMVIPDVDTTYRKRRANADAIAGWIARLAHPEKNVLALFPSYQFLRMAHDRMPPVPHHVIVQSPGSAEARQHEILDALAGGGSNLVLAVLGGIFAEGIDYPGEMLSQVIIVSPALPQFNTDRQLLRDYFRERYGHGFEYAYLIPGMTRVVQAAGRLIRSDEDRGTIILVGRRFLQPRYLQLLPDEWIDEDPSRLVFEDPEGEVRRFFA